MQNGKSGKLIGVLAIVAMLSTGRAQQALLLDQQNQPLRQFMVYFNYGRTELTERALQTIGDAADQIKALGSSHVVVVGHTDTSFPEQQSMDLSNQMARSVADELVKDGIPSQGISITAMGWRDPFVPIGPGIREPQNRRVVIWIQ